jgi:hypothetical protein
MTPENFAYWLQGFVELHDSEKLSKEQWASIKDHLKLTMNKQTPQRTIGLKPLEFDNDNFTPNPEGIQIIC